LFALFIISLSIHLHVQYGFTNLNAAFQVYNPRPAKKSGAQPPCGFPG
jgi:hypothetical protein